METLTDGQRMFGIPRFPDKILRMQGAGIIRKCVTQKVNVMGKNAFRDNFKVKDRSKVKSFYKIWTNHCQTEADKEWPNFINHPAPGNDLYQTWERELRNFANGMVRNLIDTYLPAFNEKPGVKKKQAQSQGKTVGALVDMIDRANLSI